MNEHYLETKLGKLRYLQAGEGEAILFLHGNNENADIFSGIFDAFTENYAVYALDTRGHGKSDFAVELLTFQQIAEDIVCLMDANQLKSVHIIGFSDGGNIGLYLAAHYPKRVTSLTIMGTNYDQTALVEPLYSELLEELKQLRQLAPSEEQKRKESILRLMLDQLALEESDLKAISCPVLVMAGELDVIPLSHTKQMATLIPNADLTIVPNGQHDFFIAQPSALIDSVINFYNQMRNK